MKHFKTPKGTELPVLDLRGKDYLQVAHRLVWFREIHPMGKIDTEAIEMTETHSIFKATIAVPNERGEYVKLADGWKREDKTHFQDHIEKASTGAVGRALAACGFGTQFAPDLDEGDRLADVPVKRPTQQQGPAYPQATQPKLSQQKPVVRVTPEGSRSLTLDQLKLINFEVGRRQIPLGERTKLYLEVAGVNVAEKIPFDKVSDVLGALQKYNIPKEAVGVVTTNR